MSVPTQEQTSAVALFRYAFLQVTLQKPLQFHKIHKLAQLIIRTRSAGMQNETACTLVCFLKKHRFRNQAALIVVHKSNSCHYILLIKLQKSKVLYGELLGTNLAILSMLISGKAR